MAQKLTVEGFEADRPVASLSELRQALRKWAPDLSDEAAGAMLVRPPFTLDKRFTDGEAAAAAGELRALGARVSLESAADDPTWWRERPGEATQTHLGAPAPVFAAPPPPPAVPVERGLWESWVEVILRPSAFFASPQVRDGAGASPLLFAVVFSVIGAVLATPGSYVLGSLFSAQESSLGGQVLGAAVGTPFVTVLALLFYAVGLHLGAQLFGGQGNFGVAWRIAAYSTAANVFQAVPVAGYAVMVFFYFLYSVAGLQGAYKMTPVRATAAAALPVLLFMLLVSFVLLAVALAVGLSGMQEFFEAMKNNSLQGI